jgi:hypothetical protein
MVGKGKRRRPVTLRKGRRSLPLGLVLVLQLLCPSKGVSRTSKGVRGSRGSRRGWGKEGLLGQVETEGVER